MVNTCCVLGATREGGGGGGRGDREISFFLVPTITDNQGGEKHGLPRCMLSGYPGLTGKKKQALHVHA